jgi:hypothetical protein
VEAGFRELGGRRFDIRDSSCVGRDHSTVEASVGERMEICRRRDRSRRVFHVPGPLFPVDYSGLRTGRYSKKERIIEVQIAVPPELLGRSEPDTLVAMVRLLREGVELARKKVESKAGALPVRQATHLVSAVEETILAEFSQQ